MIVREVMNKNVVVGKAELNIKEACDVMIKFNIGSLLITDDQKILGILTPKNIVKAIANGRDPEKTLVDSIMTKKVITIEPDKELEEAVDLMVENRIKKLPVVENGKLVGIISASDIITIEPRLIESIASLLSVKTPIYTGG